jgi:hypothetical protein
MPTPLSTEIHFFFFFFLQSIAFLNQFLYIKIKITIFFGFEEEDSQQIY